MLKLGIGKRHILQKLFDEYEGDFLTPVVMTSTSNPSDGTCVDGYEEISNEKIVREIEQGRTLFHKEVGGGLYAVNRSAVRRIQALGKVCVIDLDWAADAIRLQEEGFNAHYLLIAPESIDLMRDQLEKEIISNPPVVRTFLEFYSQCLLQVIIMGNPDSPGSRPKRSI